MAAPIRFLSGRQQQQKIGIEGSTEDKKVLEVVGRTGIGTTSFEPSKILDVRGDAIVEGTATVGKLEITGTGDVPASLTVETANVTGVSTFGGAVDVNAGLDVDGQADLDEVVVAGVATFSNAVDINSTLDVDGDTQLDDLTVAGVATFSSAINATDIIKGYEYTAAPFGSTVTLAVTVASKDSTHRYNGTGSSNAYVIDGIQSPFLTLTPGRTYRFTNNNTGSHPFKFYLEADKTTEYTSGVNFQNSYTEITVSDETPTVLHYQCTAHGYMGNAVQTNSNVVNTNYDAILRGGLDVDGHTELDNVNVSGAITATTFTGNLIGTVNTSAQTNITSLGTLTGLDVNGHSELDDVNISGVLTATTINATTFAGNGDFVDIDVDGHTELDNVNISGILTANSIDLTGGGGPGGQASLTHLSVSGVSTFTGAIDADGGMDVSGGETTLSSATVSDLNAGRVVLAGTGGSLEDSSKLTFDTSTGFLTVQGGASFNGNVSIGATLTYEDVTSVDSVGLVTARKGIRIDTGGVVVTSGVSTFVDNIVGTISTATNLAGGDTGDIPYQSANGATTFVDATGVAAGLVLMWGGSNPIWSPVSGASGNFGGITLLEEGAIVGSAGSVTGLDFVGNNVTATAPSGIANGTVTLSDTPTFNSLKVTGISTIPNVSGVTTFSDNVHVGTGITMYASSGIISATAFYGSGQNLTDLVNQKIEGLQLRKDGVIVGSGYTFSTLDFTGDGVSVTGVGTTGQITIPGFGPDGQQNLYAGTNAGAASDADTCNNIALGCNAACLLDSGDFNIFFGKSAGNGATGGSYNIGIGCCTNGGTLTGDNNVSIGRKAGRCLTSGTDNVFLGLGAGEQTTNCINNVFLGSYAGKCNDGSNNIALGACSLQGSSTVTDNTGGFNVAIGGEAGKCICTGANNIFLGCQAGIFASSGSGNIFLGACASGGAEVTGDCNISFGYFAGKNLTSGSNNVVLGNGAGCSMTNCNSNVFIGYQAGNRNDGGYNIFFGYRAGKGSATVSNNTGGHNIAMGMDAGEGLTFGTRNVFLGLNAGYKNTEGSCNVFLGNDAGCLTTTGDDNVYIGHEAGKTGETAHTNIAIGKMAARDATGFKNVVLGDSAGRDLTGFANVVIGQNTGVFSTGANCNVFLGAYSAQCTSGNDNVILGSQAGRYATTGCYNIFFGKCTAAGGFSDPGTGNHNIAMGCEAGLCLTSGIHNIFLGQEAGQGNTTGCYNIFFGKCTAAGGTVTGGCNVAAGRCAGYSLTSGCDNVFFGYDAGYNSEDAGHNVFIGKQAGCTNSSGGSNVAIGCQVSLPSATGSCQLAIGNGSNRWIAGDSSFNVTVSTASTFSNDGLNVTGVITATSFEGDGSNLTGIAADKIFEGNTEVETVDTGSDGHIKFTTEGSERARIDSSGRMGIGVTNPVAKLEVNVGSAVTAFDIQGSAGQLFSVTNNLTSGSIFSVNDVSGIPSIDVDADGTIQLAPFSTTEFVGVGTTNPTTKLHVIGEVTATDFNSTSDARLKTNVQTIDDPLAKVLQINGVSFNWVENNKPSMGVIADNIEEVLPELVSDTDPKTVNYNGLIGLLIEVVKDQQTQINSLNERLSQLE